MPRITDLMPSLESEDLESEDLEGQEDRERSTGLFLSVSSRNSNSVVALCDALTMSYLADIVYTTTALPTSEHPFYCSKGSFATQSRQRPVDGL